MTLVAVQKEALPAYIESRREKVRKLWATNDTIPRLLYEHFPEVWDKVRACRYNYTALNRTDDLALWSARPVACHKVPWCIPCTASDNVARAMEEVKRLWYVTPPGQAIRVFHVVITAPYTEAGTGWGALARQDVPKFFGIMRRSLDGIFGRPPTGAGVGGVMSYQDFGERPFSKPHPHMDSIVNGWSLISQDVQPIPAPKLDFGGYHRIKEMLRQYAMAFRLDANAGNFKIREATGGARVFQAVKYSMRHMIDFRNYSYDPDRRMVWYQPYKDGLPEKLKADTFVAWLDEYRKRLGQYLPVGDNKQMLHRRFGYFGRMYRIARRIIGGSPPDHKKSCQCNECQDWRKVFDEDFGQTGAPDTPLRASWGLRALEAGEAAT